MKFKTSYLFYLLTIIVGALLIGTEKSDVQMNVNDRYYIISYSHFFVPVAILSLVTALVYSLMDRRAKPINKRTGILHFVLIVIGLFLSLITYREIAITLIMMPEDAVVPFNPRFAFFLVGPLLLISGLIVFLYGLFKARKTWTNATNSI